MSTCTVCYKPFNTPVSLPCGHVFCKECICSGVESSNASSKPCCPTCRIPFPVVSVDPMLIPPYLRPHFLPPIRPVYIDSQTLTALSTSLPTPPQSNASSPASSLTNSESPSTSSSLPIQPAECTAMDAKILAALHMTTATWRRRAETHAAANSSLLAFSRSARDCALRLRAERDSARNECVVLRQKIAEMERERAGLADGLGLGVPHASPTPPINSPSPFAQPCHGPRRQTALAPPQRIGLPLFVMQCKAQALANFASPENTRSVLEGPPLKRRRTSLCSSFPSVPVSDSGSRSGVEGELDTEERIRLEESRCVIANWLG
ncbi:hypothetical protein FB45DRAFT_919317 [Roridomyces roridus]|uniref:RING-type domain-containing protein n=1 Tax=Roridomyces roridus TaxID=1738132 RepID=A0AAD7BRS1_9AGAR|nr:hypothetical protein FB45DRAFT_919317 [Roridomyces roridus]